MTAREPNKRIISLALAGTLLLSVNLFADFNQAVKLQQQKDYPGAEKAFTELYANTKDDAEKVRILNQLLQLANLQKDDAKRLQYAAGLILAPGASESVRNSGLTTLRNIYREHDREKRDHDALEKTLLAIEKKITPRKGIFRTREPEARVNNLIKSLIYDQLRTVYGAKRDEPKSLAYAQKIQALPGADLNAKINAISALLGRYRTDYGPWNYGYLATYIDHATEGELEDAKNLSIAYATELARLQPNKIEFLVQLGSMCLYQSMYDKASGAYKAAAAIEKADPHLVGAAMIGHANALYATGKKGECIKVLDEVIAKNIPWRKGSNPTGSAVAALHYLNGGSLDFLKLPYDTGAQAYPTAQKAGYSDEFIPLKSVKLNLVGDLAKSGNDVRFNLLKTKFNRFGIPVIPQGEFKVTVKLDPESAPKKPEGYTLKVATNGAEIVGNDMQGVLWGIVTLIQVVDQEKNAIRVCEIEDWPSTAKRGFLQNFWPFSLEYCLFNKMNSITSQNPPFAPRDGNQWTPLNTFVSQSATREFAAFGLDHYYGIAFYTMYPMYPLCRQSTFDLQYEVCCKVAEAGGHVYYPEDDGRFPINPEDLKKYGNAAAIDPIHITRLFRAVREKYPKFKLVFCPPFYWGPDAPHTYPEDREDYLRACGEHLDPAIQMYWTGPRVKGMTKTPAQVAWFTTLTKRKPSIFQNGTGPHNLLYYLGDTTDWKAWHYPGFFENDIEMFHRNDGTGGWTVQTATLADCLWNVKAYDPEESAKKSMSMMFGPKMYDIIKPGHDALVYFDKYPYGDVTAEIVSENIADLESKRQVIADCWEKAKQYNAFAIAQYGSFYGSGIGYVDRVIRGARNPPDFLKKYQGDIVATKGQANQEVGIDTNKGDIFKSPVDVFGGKLLVYDAYCPKRFAAVFRGKQTIYKAAKISFTCDPFPPSKSYDLYLSGQTEVAQDMPPLEIGIRLNGEVVYKGPAGFVAHGWNVKQFVLPAEKLKRSNQLVVEVETDGTNLNGPPWLMINYAVIKL